MYRIHVVIQPDPEGGFSVTSPSFPELNSEGDTFEEAVENAQDAVKTLMALYKHVGRPMPANSILPEF